MRVFTVYQPYAYAIVTGLKQYETRPRQTRIRGRVAVHAGKKKLGLASMSVISILGSGEKLHYGTVVETVEIVDCPPHRTARRGKYRKNCGFSRTALSPACAGTGTGTDAGAHEQETGHALTGGPAGIL